MSQDSQALFHLPERTLLIILSGMSGVGKDAVLHKLRESSRHLEFIVTVTSRPKRAGEKDGVHYCFVSQEEFQKLIDHGELLEHASVYGNWYGVPRSSVMEALGKKKDTVIKVDVQGAATIKKIMPDAVAIFLAPPSMDELVHRLEQRHTESARELDLRLNTAREELTQLGIFDYVVLNPRGGIGRAVIDIETIITAEKCRIVPES